VECGQRPPESIDTGRPSEDLRQKSIKHMVEQVNKFSPRRCWCSSPTNPACGRCFSAASPAALHQIEH